ncbi:MAG: tetratricopeptide repeat protein, partial [Magnetococcales bacterium]|nr:tetratricopeptide repeat protein [Magnetococcales bacterium]
MTRPIDSWLKDFQAAPDKVWSDTLYGWRSFPGYERADIADTLVMIFGGLEEDDPLITTLDATLTAWIDPYLAWPDAQRREFGLARYVHWFSQTLSAGAQLGLPGLRQHAFDSLLRWRGILHPLCLAPQRDPLAATYRMIASSPQHARPLESFWLGLCRQVDDTLPGHYLNIGLLGLRQCPQPEPGAAMPWIGGLAAWLPHARSKRVFIRKFRSLRALYPRAPEKWQTWIEPVLESLSGGMTPQEQERLGWWRKELGSPGKKETKGGQARIIAKLSAPTFDDLQRIMAFFEKREWEVTARALKNLFLRHERFVEQTGDSYFLVRASAEAAKKLIRHQSNRSAKLALQLLRRALILEPWDSICWQIYGRCLVFLGETLAAEWVFWEAYRRDPVNPVVPTELGQLLIRENRLDEAEKVLQGVLRIDPENVHARTELGRLLMLKKRHDEAEEVLREAMRIDQEDVHARTELGQLLILQKRHDEAEEVLREAMRIDPKNVHARTELGQLLMQADRLDAAEKVILEGLEIDSTDSYLQKSLAQLSTLKQQEENEAVQTGGDNAGPPLPVMTVVVADDVQPWNLAREPEKPQIVEPVESPQDGPEKPSSETLAPNRDEEAEMLTVVQEEPDIMGTETKPSDPEHEMLRPPAMAKRADFFL